MMRPARDPLRSLVYSAADRAIRDVFVDGELATCDPAETLPLTQRYMQR